MATSGPDSQSGTPVFPIAVPLQPDVPRSASQAEFTTRAVVIGAVVALLSVILSIAAATVSAQQGGARRATNAAALLAHPEYFHQRPVMVVGDLKLLDSGELRLNTDGSTLRVVNKGNTPEGTVEVRGEFWDLGKFNADDPRLTGYDLRRTFGIDPEGSWPRLGQVTALIASAIAPATPPSVPSVGNVVLYPSRYLDQRITLVGQFGGRNLLGDLQMPRDRAGGTSCCGQPMRPSG